jgi:hypothetical protein
MMRGLSWNLILAAVAGIVLTVGAGCASSPEPTPPVDSQKASPQAAAKPVKPDAPTDVPKPQVAPTPVPPTSPTPVVPAVAAPTWGKEWINIFDGKTLTNWKPTPFDETGKVEVADGQIILGRGKGDMTGVTWSDGDLPKLNYEIALEAKRVEGDDFFCGLTFPIKNSCMSLIVGGWGGTLVGLSCLDGYDASNNETTHMQTFEMNQWYRIRVRVTDKLVEAWIDDEQVVEGALMRHDVDDKMVYRRISVRSEVEASQPMGVAAWRTKAAVRGLRLRLLTDAEIAAAEKVAADKQGP